MMQPLTEIRSKHIRELLRNARARRGDSEFVLEGPHLLEAALEKAPKLIFYIAATTKAEKYHGKLLDRAASLEIPAYMLAQKFAERIADVQETQGLFAVLKMPAPKEIRGDVAIALDGVQDPGNVGTIIRTAAWFNAPSILLGQGTADPYAPKVVRGTQGAIFDVSLETSADLTRRLTDLQKKGWHVIAATVDADAKSVFDFSFPKQTLLLFGNEARGIRPELLTIAEDRVFIPRYGAVESLNVSASAAIVLAELRRRS